MVFLSHANPEDNAITEWLALQLAREGYPVWCDLTKLLGGEDFWEDIERAIRERTVKFLYVLSRASSHKPGPLKELAVASKVQKKERIKDFIIPLWIGDLSADDFNIELNRLIAIRFQEGWAKGLAQLLKKLDEDGVPRKPNFGPAAVTTWWREHMNGAATIRGEPESLLTNQYPLGQTTLYFHELSRTGIGAIELPPELPAPGVSYNQYLVSFAPAEAFIGGLGPALCIKSTQTRQVGGEEPDPAPRMWGYKDERNTLTQLLRETWQTMIKQRGLPTYEFANKVIAFYFPKDLVPSDRIVFTGPDGTKSRRNVVGYKTVQRGGSSALRYWHFGLQAKPMTSPVLGYTLKAHVLFSDDGEKIWDSTDRLHKARRTQCRNWWNDKWRDLIGATASWLANDTPYISLPVHSELVLKVAGKPLALESPVTYDEPGELPDEETLDISDGDEEADELEELAARAGDK